MTPRLLTADEADQTKISAQVLDAIAEEAESIAYRIRARKPGGGAIDGPPSVPDEVRP